jgi:YaiO family outer membrane protein
MMAIKSLWAVFFLTLLATPCIAQEWKSLTDDQLFEQARKTMSQERESGREMLRYLLEKNPRHHDARVLLGRTYAWDKNYAGARKELQRVINENPKHEDALLALMDVELWDQQYSEALTLMEFLNDKVRSSEDVQYKKALALSKTGHPDEAVNILNSILSSNPAHAQASDLLRQICSDKLKHTATLSYGTDLFNRTFDPAHYGSAQLSRLNKWGSAILKLNFAHRFDLNGFQPELDLYLRISGRIYAYLNYGYSDSKLFPDHRVGAEIFSRSGKRAEFSLGIRYLDFDESDVMIYTGSAGYYWGSYWLSLRSFIIPEDQVGTTVSATMALRRYFADRDNYLGISAGGGFSPDERRLQTTAGLTTYGIYILASQRAGLVWSKTMKNNFILVTNGDCTRQELIFDEGEYVFITSFAVALKKRF